MREKEDWRQETEDGRLEKGDMLICLREQILINLKRSGLRQDVIARATEHALP
jgi:hypothetical protein